MIQVNFLLQNFLLQNAHVNTGVHNTAHAVFFGQKDMPP
jgi:hypothetical protein